MSALHLYGVLIPSYEYHINDAHFWICNDRSSIYYITSYFHFAYELYYDTYGIKRLIEKLGKLFSKSLHHRFCPLLIGKPKIHTTDVNYSGSHRCVCVLVTFSFIVTFSRKKKIEIKIGTLFIKQISLEQIHITIRKFCTLSSISARWRLFSTFLHLKAGSRCVCVGGRIWVGIRDTHQLRFRICLVTGHNEKLLMTALEQNKIFVNNGETWKCTHKRTKINPTCEWGQKYIGAIIWHSK